MGVDPTARNHVGGKNECGWSVIVDGDIRMAWVSLMVAFGSVEILERSTWADAGHLYKLTWLAVCVEPLWTPYTGSLVVVREAKNGTVYVQAADNHDVLFDDPTTQFFTDEADGVSGVPFPVTLERDRFVFRLITALADGKVEVDKAGIIVGGTGEFGQYYTGMKFRHFMRELQKADKTATFTQVKS